MGKNEVINEVSKLSKEEILKLYKKQFEKNVSLVERLNNTQVQLEKSIRELNEWQTKYARAYVNRQNDLIAENTQLKEQVKYYETVMKRDCDVCNIKLKQIKTDIIIESLDRLKTYVRVGTKCKIVSKNYFYDIIDERIKELQDENIK